MHAGSIETIIFLIFTGAAVFATLALFARQTMIVAYILLGILLGPWGFALVDNIEFIEGISKIGIIFLLYLLGLDLLPQQLLKTSYKALAITLSSSAVFLLSGFLIAYGFGHGLFESLLIGAVMMFSSTIIGLKLLPATTLHHGNTGKIIISILLIQDLMAIIILLLLQGYGKGENPVIDIGLQLLYLPVFIVFTWMLNRFVIIKLIRLFDQIHEYIFLLAIGWCLGIAELAHFVGLSHEIGAFIAGVTLASSPIALFITERLKPLRDFFLVIFFFALGAKFNVSIIDQVLLPALVLAGFILIIKPLVFKYLLIYAGEDKPASLEIGVRLGQISEFSLLIAAVAVESDFISLTASYLIQLATMITFIASSYAIVLKYPTPIAINEKLRRD